MYKDLALFKVASALASHAESRQSIIAQNIANADTPGYKTRDLEAFSDAVQRHPDRPAMTMTRAGHQSTTSALVAARIEAPEDVGSVAPNGNNVSLETELVKSTEIRHQHDLALSVYRNGLDLLRAGLGRG